jgi:hypothetical protein
MREKTHSRQQQLGNFGLVRYSGYAIGLDLRGAANRGRHTVLGDDFEKSSSRRAPPFGRVGLLRAPLRSGL